MIPRVCLQGSVLVTFFWLMTSVPAAPRPAAQTQDNSTGYLNTTDHVTQTAEAVVAVSPGQTQSATSVATGSGKSRSPSAQPSVIVTVSSRTNSSSAKSVSASSRESSLLTRNVTADLGGKRGSDVGRKNVSLTDGVMEIVSEATRLERRRPIAEGNSHNSRSSSSLDSEAIKTNSSRLQINNSTNNSNSEASIQPEDQTARSDLERKRISPPHRVEADPPGSRRTTESWTTSGEDLGPYEATGAKPANRPGVARGGPEDSSSLQDGVNDRSAQEETELNLRVLEAARGLHAGTTSGQQPDAAKRGKSSPLTPAPTGHAYVTAPSGNVTDATSLNVTGATSGGLSATRSGNVTDVTSLNATAKTSVNVSGTTPSNATSVGTVHLVSGPEHLGLLVKHLAGFMKNMWGGRPTQKVPGPSNDDLMDDGPLGSVLMRERQYLISVLIPIGVGITGAMLIIIMAYVSRLCGRRDQDDERAPRMIFNPGMGRRSSDRLPLHESTDEEI